MNGIAVSHRRLSDVLAAVLFTALLIAPNAGFGQGEETTRQRYMLREKSSGYYEQYEVRPRDQRSVLAVPGVSPRGVFSYSPTGAEVRIRARLKDSHMGVRFYGATRCEECHAAQAENPHTIRGGITCRQCHGDEPIAHINHYYSPLNPIRKHAYLCSKCHEGASVSYGSYIVHEPPAGSPAAKASFPVLYYVSWFMLALLVGTLSFSVPHSFMVGIRELIAIMRRGKTQ